MLRAEQMGETAATRMLPPELRAIMAALDLSAGALAQLVQVESGRTVRRWLSGERDIPGPVTVLMRLLVTCPAARKALGVELIKKAS